MKQSLKFFWKVAELKCGNNNVSLYLGVSLSDLTEATYNANYARQNEELPFELEVTCYTLLTEEQVQFTHSLPPDVFSHVFAPDISKSQKFL